MSQKHIVVENLQDLIRCITLSSLLELAGWPKIGNVHRTRDFVQTTFEHFLAGIATIQPNFFSLCKRINEKVQSKYDNLSIIQLGLFYKQSALDMINWQSGGNVLLGHILILAPLFSAAVICIKFGLKGLDEFKLIVNRVIEDATIEDTINLYKAIRICKPGGLGTIDKYDIYNQNSFEQLREDKITLKKIFQLSMDYDLISKEYATGFSIIIDKGVPYLFNTFIQTNNINETVVNTFLYILSEYPDTLIIRKVGKKSAQDVSNLALNILKHKGITSKKGLRLALKYDKKIQKKNGLLNPGTTADILAGVIFCALIFGLKF
ncbi:MAG: triphosphoribosyl-dephospho-CoA synthase [Candidatus Hermodarchaeota archaeon]